MISRGRVLAAVGVILGLGIASLLCAGSASLPVRDGVLKLPGLQAPVAVAFDGYGIPVVTAGDRLDAMRALGYVTAQDRLFQMDLLRRNSAGRLAEVLGESALQVDLRQRNLGLSPVAETVLRRLPEEQRAVLEAYTEGVNAFLEQMTVPPFEFLLLGYRPARWSPTDSILVVLAMFQMLNGYEDDERMRTVMKASLPEDVTGFLLPPLDTYTARLFTGTMRQRSPVSVPVEALASLRQAGGQSRAIQTSVVPGRKRELGSNAWAVAGAKTEDGRAILANDMHLDVGVPNIWYRVQLRYGRVEVAGVIVPGIPVVIAGSNGLVSWGMTNVEGDFLDLVRLDLNPNNADEYATPDGWRRFTIRNETIAVKGDRDRVVEFKETLWGPVAEKPLMGHPVALRWIALDPDAVDLGLLQMDQARTVKEAIAVANRAGGPPNNVVLAAADGHIAWTFMGRIPVRRGFDGSVSVSWADGRTGWNGFIAPDELPRIIDPPSGFLVSANHRMVGEEYPHVIGHAFANGYRAYRITQRLRDKDRFHETDLLALQLDTTAQLYEFYRDLVKRLLSESVIEENPDLADVRRVVEAWEGRADSDSKGFGLLVAFRRTLAASVFAPFLQSCREQDAGFVYDGDLDTPLRTLLTEQAPAVLPDPARFADWNTFLLHQLKQTVETLKTDYDQLGPGRPEVGNDEPRAYDPSLERGDSRTGALAGYEG
jgi:penicillin amidase